MELGRHKDREKLRPTWEVSPQPLGYITAAHALSTELQVQTGVGRGNLRCQFQGNEYVQVQGRFRFLQKLAV